MKVKICPGCETQNYEDTWNCIKCGTLLLLDTISDSIALVLDSKNSHQQDREVNLPVHGIHQKMARDITYFMAAGYIASKDFPKKDSLPPIMPPPFSNMGHQVLIDYKLLSKIVWQVVDDVQVILEKFNWKIKLKWVLFAIITILVLLGLSNNWVLAIIVGTLVFFGGSSYAIHQKYKKEVGEIRAKAITKLIEGKWLVDEDGIISKEIEEHLALVGNGELDADVVPILTVINNDSPFPGYGYLQFDNVMFFGPKQNSEEEMSLPTLNKIKNHINEDLIKMFYRYGVEHVSFGYVVVIHGHSIFIDSPWLGEDKSPKLWLDRKELGNVSSIDKRASVRVYFAAQILFPQYMTAATFFIRPFIAGNSGACQIAVTTLGPSKFSLDYLQRRLLKHRLENREKSKEEKKKKNQKETISRARKQLQIIQAIGQSEAGFQLSLNTSMIKELDYLDEEENLEAYAKELRKTIEESVKWPGYVTTYINIREANSLTFTNSYFGIKEASTAIVALYNQISKSVIDTYDTMGFDVTAYKSRDGEYKIEAGSIDQLIVGQEIQIIRKEKSQEKPSAESITTNATE